MMSKPPLKVAIAVAGRQVPRWQSALVSDAVSIAGAEVSVIRLQRDPRQHPPAPPSLQRLDKVDHMVTRRLTSVANPLDEAFIDLPIQTANFRKAHYDVVIELGGMLRQARALMAHRGVWSFVFGKDLRQHDDYPCLEEVLAGDEVTTASLVERPTAGKSAWILSEAHVAVDRHSIFVTRAQALWAATQMAGAALRRLTVGALTAARPLPGGGRDRAGDRPAVTGDKAFNFCRGAAGYAWRSLIKRDQWQVHYRLGPTPNYQEPDLSGFSRLPLPKGGFFADPFVVEREGRKVIFGEEYPYATRRGVISCVELVEGEAPAPPVRVLERPYHLSYPFLIEEEGVLYMIPESAANETVELYRCTRFPDAWQLEATLLRGIKAVDTTIARIDGKLWMFTAVKRPETRNFDELHLYVADCLTGPWRPHPANPVRFDARDARPAGALFRDGESWIRPAQDATLRYGRRVHFQRITTLTETAYREEPAGLLDPSVMPGAEGIHTWNNACGVTLIDSVRQMSKFGSTSDKW